MMSLSIKNNKPRIIFLFTGLAFVFVFIMMIALFLYFNKKTEATVSGWMAGRIIDDSVFTNKSSMTASQIQTFLNTQVPTCDTYGQQLSEFGGPDLNSDGKVQRWEWGKAYYNQTVFTCLKNYKENNISAAQIIYNVAQTYSINPRVLLVLLQKEQSLVTDTWPLNIQYRSATGFGCPDTAACDTAYYGFTNQVTWAATMFRKIMDDAPDWYTPYNLGNNYIRYNPNTACGGSTVYIQNRATQALYNYTPYQPNAATLDANWGVTVTCGAYGNLNFYRYYTKWFGATTSAATYSFSLVSKELYSDYTYQTKITDTPSITPGQTIYARITVKNTGNQAWYSENMKIGTADPRDRKSDFETFEGSGFWTKYNRPAYLNESYINTGETGTFEFALKAPVHLGSYNESFSLVIEGYRWLDGLITIPINVYSPKAYYYIKPISLDAYSDEQMTKKLDPTKISLYTDSKIYVRATIKNTGNRDLSVDITKVATTNPLDRSSIYSDDSWLSSNRASIAKDGNIPPQETGVFEFTMTAPSEATDRANEQFGLVLEYQKWLSSNIGSFSIQTKTKPPTILTSGQLLVPGESLLSSNEKYQFIFQNDGNLVIYSYGKPVWASWTMKKGGTKLIMQNDGNLVLYTATNKAIWHTRTSGKGSSHLDMQSDGNLVIYTDLGKFTWASWTINK